MLFLHSANPGGLLYMCRKLGGFLFTRQVSWLAAQALVRPFPTR
jgi:hypothetical protein